MIRPAGIFLAIILPSFGYARSAKAQLAIPENCDNPLTCRLKYNPCGFGGFGDSQCGDDASAPQHVSEANCQPSPPSQTIATSGSPYITRQPGGGYQVDVSDAEKDLIQRITGVAAQRLMLKQKEDGRPFVLVSPTQGGGQASSVSPEVSDPFENMSEIAEDAISVTNERVGTTNDYVTTLPMAFKIGATLSNPEMSPMSKVIVCSALIGDVAVPSAFAGVGAIVGAGAGPIGAVGGGVGGGIAGRYVAGKYIESLSEENQNYYREMNDMGAIVRRHEDGRNGGN